MSLRALILLQDHAQDSNDPTKILAYVKVTILGTNVGTKPQADYFLQIPGINPGLLGGMKSAIENAVVADLVADSVPYNTLLDSVRLYD